MKTKEELNELKKEVEALNKKLRELNEEELSQVIGGVGGIFVIDETKQQYEINVYENQTSKDQFTPKFEEK